MGASYLESKKIGSLLIISGIIIVTIFIFLVLALDNTFSLMHGFLLLTCVQLYYGSKWARVVIGLSLSVLGGFWIYNMAMHRAFLFMVFGGVAAATVAGMLLSKGTLFVLDERRLNRTPTTQRILKAMWIIFLILIAWTGHQDIKKILFS